MYKTGDCCGFNCTSIRYSFFKTGFAITLNSSNKQLFWRQIDLDPHIENKNTWNEMIDSTLIPSTINNRAGLELKVFGFNASKKSYMEYDDIEVKLLIVSK